MNQKTLFIATVFLTAFLQSTAYAADNTFPTSGYVGIGTTNPEATLHIQGSDAINESIRLQNTTSGSFSFNTYGSVGAGTHGSGLDSANTNSIYSTNPFFLITNGNNPLHFLTNNTTRMMVGSDGNVGIGTTSPEVPLQVVGTIRSDVWQPNGAASNDLYVDVEPDSRTLRTRNWNSGSPNIAATGIHTGTGEFEGDVTLHGNIVSSGDICIGACE